MFQKKTADPNYGPGQHVFTLKVMKHDGKTVDGVNTFTAKYMRVRTRACMGELETFNQGDLHTCSTHPVSVTVSCRPRWSG